MTLDHITKGRLSPDVLFVSGYASPQKTTGSGYDMPYRMLLPKDLDGLLVCGRGASYVRRGHDPGTRARMNMMLLGQAAGTAAAIVASSGSGTRKADIRKIQRGLKAEGFPLGDRTRLKQLGLAR